MNAAEIKLDLFRKLDGLQGDRLKEAYGILLNYVNGQKEDSEWKALTDEQRSALLSGIKQLDAGKGKSHINILAEMREKYNND